MESPLANEAREELLRRMAKLTAEERLEAFVRHNELIAELRRAGQAVQPPPRSGPLE
jgi:hypothetical protein